MITATNSDFKTSHAAIRSISSIAQFSPIRLYRARFSLARKDGFARRVYLGGWVRYYDAFLSFRLCVNVDIKRYRS